MKKIGILFLLFLSLASSAQTKFSNLKSRLIEVSKDSIFLEETSISQVDFKIFENGKQLQEKDFSIDFSTSLLKIDAKKHPIIRVDYFVYPDFLTKKYAALDKKIIVPYRTKSTSLFQLSTNETKNEKPFDGLNTQGSLVRGVSVGNNQNAVLNSSLDLQISGKLSDNVSIQASITDSSIPFQENGYSQKINEFDRVFIELYSDDWSLKAGDILLNNSESQFLKFDKKVAGLSVETKLKHENSTTDLFASGALVRGKFTRQEFKGSNGNQGPYKLQGPNGELFIVILSASETVFVNGIPLKRGAENDYTIDYNTAEITFTTTYPITSNMRIVVEFQYSDRNYTRFVTFNKAKHQSEKLAITGYFYNENDAKNQPLQQNLSDEQIKILSLAGNDKNKMFDSSGIIEEYDVNKIQYILTNTSDTDVFVYTNQQIENEIYYNVNFHYAGNLQGDYRFLKNTPTGKIYEYLGKNLGDYQPLQQLIAPTKLQIAVADIVYAPNNKTNFKTEIGISNNDENLFSDIDNAQNKGTATKLAWQQIYSDKKWLLKSDLQFDYLQENFKTLQRIYSVEFSRDWAIENTFGNQKYLKTELLLSNKKDLKWQYVFENLAFGSHYQGTKHNLISDLKFGKTTFSSKTNYLNSQSSNNKTSFLKANTTVKHHFTKTWLGTSLAAENYLQKNILTEEANPNSQKLIAYDAFFGIGDSTKIYTKIGFNSTRNDSIRNNNFTHVNTAKNYYLQSQFLQNKNSSLQVYLNYRNVENRFFENTQALNSRIMYDQKLFDQLIRSNTVYETSSGTLPQQEFTYLKTEPGQGFYTWIDYNNNGEQEYDEFEIAKFTDQATYLRVALPSVNYLKINQIKLSQSLWIDPSGWKQEEGFLKWISQFSNQSNVLIDSKKTKSGNGFDFNPFEINNPNVLGLQYSLRNSLFFRRGLQKYSSTFNVSQSKQKNNFGFGIQENQINQQQFQFQHLLGTLWLFELAATANSNKNTSDNFTDRNYYIVGQSLEPTITLQKSKNSNFSFQYEFKKKVEDIQTSSLTQQKIGASYQYSHPLKGAVFADVNYHKNNFSGTENTAVSYQMLEGLQAGNNFVWNLILQKKINSYLDLNINYSGRKGNVNNTIHTGNIQVRANF